MATNSSEPDESPSCSDIPGRIFIGSYLRLICSSICAVSSRLTSTSVSVMLSSISSSLIQSSMSVITDDVRLPASTSQWRKSSLALISVNLALFVSPLLSILPREPICNPLSIRWRRSECFPILARMSACLPAVNFSLFEVRGFAVFRDLYFESWPLRFRRSSWQADSRVRSSSRCSAVDRCMSDCGFAYSSCKIRRYDWCEFTNVVELAHFLFPCQQRDHTIVCDIFELITRMLT